MDVYLEAGAKRTVAAAVEWPGWARARKSAEEALLALLEYGPRYRTSMGGSALDLEPPISVGQLIVVARLEGNATTDIGAPARIADFDLRPISPAELRRQLTMLEAAWAAFARAADAAEGRLLAPAGPRGGGRTLDKMRAHVADADAAYSSAVGGSSHPSAGWDQIRAEFSDAVERRARGELPDRGPRGGQRWPARFAIRRSAWHALDHAWEIEDRLAAADAT